MLHTSAKHDDCSSFSKPERPIALYTLYIRVVRKGRCHRTSRSLRATHLWVTHASGEDLSDPAARSLVNGPVVSRLRRSISRSRLRCACLCSNVSLLAGYMSHVSSCILSNPQFMHNVKCVQLAKQRGQVKSASWIHSYFDNVISKLILNNRTDAWKTDINLLNRVTTN